MVSATDFETWFLDFLFLRVSLPLEMESIVYNEGVDSDVKRLSTKLINCNIVIRNHFHVLQFNIVLSEIK